MIKGARVKILPPRNVRFSVRVQALAEIESMAAFAFESIERRYDEAVTEILVPPYVKDRKSIGRHSFVEYSDRSMACFEDDRLMYKLSGRSE